MNTQALILVSGGNPTADENGLIDYKNQLIQLPQFKTNTDAFVKHYEDDIVTLAKNYESVGMLGHSFGGWAIINAAKILDGTSIKIRFLIGFDPVDLKWKAFNNFTIPNNVDCALVLQRDIPWWLPFVWFPPSSPIRNPNATFINLKIPTWDHANFCRRADVQRLSTSFIQAIYK